MPSKLFTIGDERSPDPEPVEFDLAGTRADGTTPWTEHFTCLTRAPAAIGLLLAQCFTVVDGDVVVGTAAIMRALRTLVALDDRERFEVLLNDPDRLVEVGDLGEVAWWLNEVYSRRPTGPQRTSPAGSPRNGKNGLAPASKPKAATPTPAPTT